MLIEFSELNLKLLVLIIYPLFSEAEYYSRKLYIKKDNSYFSQFRYFTSYILSFILLIISHYRSKSNIIDQKSINNNNNIINITPQAYEMNNEIDEIKKNINKKRKIKTIIYLLSLCIIGLSSFIYRIVFENTEYKYIKQGLGVFSSISFYVLLSYFILKQQLYKHNFISLIIIGFFLIIIFIISLLYTKSEYILSSIFYYIFYSLIFSLSDVLKKKYMIDLSKSPYLMMFMIGIINSFLLFIYDIFAYNFNRDISGIIIGFQNNIKSVGNFFAFILDLILAFIWSLGIWLTIYFFTPCHFFICDYINEYIQYLIKYSTSNFYSTSNTIIFSFVYFINFFCFLVFNEVIILNFCNLDYNTKKRIRERMKYEDASSNKEIPLTHINTIDFLDEKNE